MKSTLKPCPFCGAEAIIYRDKGVTLESGEFIEMNYVVCSECTALVSGLTEADAITEWNSRVNDGEV